MGFLSSLFGRGGDGGAGRFVSEEALRANIAKQIRMSPLTLAELRKHGVPEAEARRLEFFFYTNSSEKAAALTGALRGIGYEADARGAAKNKREFVVTGWTTPMQMSDAVVAPWAERMCRLGFEHDAEFDGWGTNV